MCYEKDGISVCDDTLLESYINMLDYVDKEHSADHKDGYCDDEKKDCITCNWIADAEENLKSLQKIVPVFPDDETPITASDYTSKMFAFAFAVNLLLTGKD